MVTTYLYTLRLFSRNARLYLLTIAAVGFAFDGGIYSVLFNLYLLRLGYGPEFVGLINSVGPLAFAFFSLAAGTLGARWGTGRMMAAGLGLMAVGCGLLPLGEFGPVRWQVGWLLTTYVTIFIGLSLYFVNSLPFLMDASGPAERNHLFSMQLASFLSAAFVGSLIAGLLPGLLAGLVGLSLNQPAPYRYTLLVAALLLIPGTLIMRSAEEIGAGPAVGSGNEPAAVKVGLARLAAFPFVLVAFLIIVRFLVVGGMAISVTFFNVYMDAGLQVSTARIGALSAVGRLLAVPAAVVTPVLAARWGNGRLIILVAFGVALAMLPLALVPHWAAAGLGFIGVIGLSSIRISTFLLYSMEIVPPRLRAVVSGVGEMAAGLSFAALAASGGYIIIGAGYRELFLLGASLSALGGLIFWVYFRTPRGELARQPVNQI